MSVADPFPYDVAVEIIMGKVEHAQLEKLYSIPPFETVTQLLVSIALVRGRLGKVSIAS